MFGYFHVTKGDTIREIHGPVWLAEKIPNVDDGAPFTLCEGFFLGSLPTQVLCQCLLEAREWASHLCVPSSCPHRSLQAFRVGLDKWEIKRGLKRAVKAATHEVRNHSVDSN